MARSILCSACLLACVTLAPAAAPPSKAASSKGKPAEVYGLTKIWKMHLKIQAGDWSKMHPTTGGFGRPLKPGEKAAPQSDDRKPRGGFGFDFEYVKGDVTIDGALLKDVGVRFKGNSSFGSAQGLKKPFRLDFDRYDDKQSFKGVRKVSLNNHVMDPTCARENLSFALYREAGVPAPRTAYVELYLTVPGKHTHELLGLYTLIEAVDKPFFKDRVGSGAGVIYKPERVGPLDYLGEDDKLYEDRYRPRPKGNDAARKRLIDLSWLAQQSDEKKFAAEIGQLLDVDSFLRYLACTVLLSSLDSFVGLGHNYFLYLNPKTDKFSFVPWDLDHSFGGLNFIGTSATLSDLSIRRPHLGRNRLIDRVLADEKNWQTYRGYLTTLMKTSYTEQRVKQELDLITRETATIREREKVAATRRGESRPGGGILGALFTASSNLPGFVAKRTASVEAQLAGKSEGAKLNFGAWGLNNDPGWLMLARPLLDGANTNGSAGLKRDEAIAGVRKLFAQCDPKNTGSVDVAMLTTGLGKILPDKLARGGSRNLPAQIAKGLIEKAGKDGKLTADALVAYTESSFARADRNKNFEVDEREIADALRVFLPPAPQPFAPPPPPAEKKKKENGK